MTPGGGKVYLVGAGPGDVGLITVRGTECLAQSDVVVYDNLANPLLLKHAPVHAELIFAGKQSSHHIKSQEEINGILADRAGRGLTVTRLKGGDPFLFGRGGEEADFLHQQNIPVEVVPGITSAIAVPAYAGIPVTHRSVNGSLHIVTGHETVDGVGPEIDWSVLAKSKGTIVFLMGVGNLAYITSQLTANGMDASTPIALVRWGTMPEQHTLISTVGEVAEEARMQDLKPPAVGVIGDVVNLRSALQWAESRPLFGIRAALTRPAEKNASLEKLLRNLGAESVITPTIRIAPLPVIASTKALLLRVRAGDFHFVVLTSVTAVGLFRDALFESGLDFRDLSRVKIAAIGGSTAQALRSFGIEPDLIPPEASQEGLAHAIAASQIRILIPRATIARDVLERTMAKIGADLTILPLYETLPDLAGISNLIAQLRLKRLNLLTFTSESTFANLIDQIPELERQELFQGIVLASIGPVTSRAIEASGLKVSIEAPTPSMEQLASAIEYYYISARGLGMQAIV